MAALMGFQVFENFFYDLDNFLICKQVLRMWSGCGSWFSLFWSICWKFIDSFLSGYEGETCRNRLHNGKIVIHFKFFKIRKYHLYLWLDIDVLGSNMPGRMMDHILLLFFLISYRSIHYSRLSHSSIIQSSKIFFNAFQPSLWHKILLDAWSHLRYPCPILMASSVDPMIEPVFAKATVFMSSFCNSKQQF